MSGTSRRTAAIVVAATLIILLGLGVLAVVLRGRLSLEGTSTWRQPPAPPARERADGPPGPTDREPGPERVLLFIGDGMGVGALSTASDLGGSDGEGGFAMTGLPVVGLVSTSAADDAVTDSAAAATAMATGFKAPRGALSVLADGGRPLTLFEAARRQGFATGLVTTAGLVDATPAAFVAHVPSRRQYGAILAQMLVSGTEVLIGGDWSRLEAAGLDHRYVELVEGLEAAVPAGVHVVRTDAALQSAAAPLVALLPPRTGSRVTHGPPLAETTRRALELLDADPGGFLLMVECGEIDSAGHANDLGRLVAGVEELDAAVAVGLRYAASKGRTLVLVTADHDTGGPGITSGPYVTGPAIVRWLGGGHSAQWVPLFASGPGASAFGRVLDNTEIARALGRMLDLRGFPGAV